MKPLKHHCENKDGILPPGLKTPKGYWHQQACMAMDRASECYMEGNYDEMKEWLELAYEYENKEKGE